MSTADPITSNTIVVRNQGFMAADIDEETVALNVETGKCYGLNEVGSQIWKLIATPIRVDEICSKLVAEYDVAPELCQEQVIDLLEELRAEGIVAEPAGT